MKAPNVTIKDSIIRGGTGPKGNGIVNSGDLSPNFALEDSEVVPTYPSVGLDSAIQITQDAGPLSGVLIDGNWADAGSVTFNIANKPLASLDGITVTNNVFGHAAVTGCQILYTSVTAIALSGNVYADSGQPVVALDNGSTT